MSGPNGAQAHTVPKPPTVLARILESTRERLVRAKLKRPPQSLIAEVSAMPADSRAGSFARALQSPRVSVIAEFKRRSPSAGSLHEAPELAEIVSAYERGGAAAISVLTEGEHFGGSLEDLREARGVCGLPILRKDFILDPYQLYEAKLTGADAVLLIVAALSDTELDSLHEQALSLGLDVLVEVHDGDELERALRLEAKLIGINNRDLRDFSIDVERTFQLLDAIPQDVSVVSESGITEHAQLERLHSSGVQAVLVGEALMRASDPARALQGLRGQ